MLTKVEKVNKFLNEGQKIEIEGTIYALSEKGKIGIVCFDENYNSTDKVLELNADLKFIENLADKLSEKDYFLLGANSVLNSK